MYCVEHSAQSCASCTQVLGRIPYGGDFYVIGKSPVALYSAASNSVNSGLFQGNYDETSYTPRLLDYGSVYASKSFKVDDGRQLMMSWIFETSVGCDQMCSSGTPFTNASVSSLTLLCCLLRRQTTVWTGLAS